MLTVNQKPLYEHDCDRCQFLGIEMNGSEKVDVYYCAQAIPLPTMILRSSSKPWDYHSCDIGLLLRTESESRSLNLMARIYQEHVQFARNTHPIMKN